MTIYEKAKQLTDHLKTLPSIDVYTHDDTDGVTAGTIISIALERAGIPHTRQAFTRPHEEDIKNPEISLLCDVGAALGKLPATVMIADHHLPQGTEIFPYHVNPILEGLDDNTELSGAGCAYLIARCLGENYDLAAFVCLGIIGDAQKLQGVNEEIFFEAVPHGLLEPKRTVDIRGNTPFSQVAKLVVDYLPTLQSISVEAINECCNSTEHPFAEKCLEQIFARADKTAQHLSEKYGREFSQDAMRAAYVLERLVYSFAAVDRVDDAYNLALGDASKLREAWDITVEYQKAVTDALDATKQLSENPSVWFVENEQLVSSVADILNRELQKSIYVISPNADGLRISARSNGTDNVADLTKRAAEPCGGSGGGHTLRAGGQIPAGKEQEFIASLKTLKGN